MSNTSSFTVSNPIDITSNGSSQEASYCTTEEIVSLRRHHRVKDGIKRLTEKYDSIGNFIPMTGRPPSIASLKSAKEERERLASFGSNESNSISQSPSRTSFAEGISEHDLLQVEMFYRSHKTEVHVCTSLANLYFGKVVGNKEKWKFAMTGIPVLVLDTGKHQRDRKLHVILAEKDDELLKLSKGKKKKVKTEKTKKFKPPKKTEISQPCCFVHVTKLENSAMENLQNNKSVISGPVAFENLLDIHDKKEKDSLEVSSLLGSKLTINSDISSTMSEDPTSVSSYQSEKGIPD
ncbi:unnamed protein product [Mytilus coruscus]|uniref:Uncharacterized protein n=1 Tax=Mytilus coruscus TaxID=42192 RepID=A0A6J8DWP6_MYTCO|nr:unnamed protein product [Mytilus coruscus]